jgi:hypothetical protein
MESHQGGKPHKYKGDLVRKREEEAGAAIQRVGSGSREEGVARSSC